MVKGERDYENKVLNKASEKLIKQETAFLQSAPKFTFKWDETSKHVHTVYIQRVLKDTVYEKRAAHESLEYDTVPFGWQLK